LARADLFAILERIAERIAAETDDDMPAAAIAGADGFCVVARDLTADNAVDKVIGWMVMEGADRRWRLLFHAGRVTAGIVDRARVAGLLVVASPLLPTCDAVEAAHEAGITLIGRSAGDDRTVFAHAWRIDSHGARDAGDGDATTGA
jgi:FdhD protein